MNLRLGRWSQRFAPGYGWCERCRTPWRFVRLHTTDYIRPSLEPPRAGRGVFALCQKCWGDLGDPSARLPYYRQVWERWERLASANTRHVDPSGLDEGWRLIRDAVLAGR